MISIPMGNVPIGTIVAFVLDKKNIPLGWLLCDGSTIPSKYTQLISALNSNNTPNLSGRTLIGAGTPVFSENQDDGRSTQTFPPSNTPTKELPVRYTGGEYVHLLLEFEMPPHSHQFTGYNTNYRPSGTNIADSGDDISAADCSCWGTKNTSQTGPNSAHNNMQPYYTVHYIIYTGQNN